MGSLQDWRYKAGLEQGATDERRHIEDALRALYHDSIDTSPKVLIAKLCDEYLDRSGALLGRVREKP